MASPATRFASTAAVEAASVYTRTRGSVPLNLTSSQDPSSAKNLKPSFVERVCVRTTGRPVVRTQVLNTNDGFKFFADDGSWLLVRFSGTEPLVRVYTEAASAAAVDANLVAGEAMVRGS